MKERRHSIARLAIALATAFALMSLGGVAIVGAPVLLLALWWASLRAKTWVRAGMTLLAALVMTEVGWFIAYAVVGEHQPYIVLAPSLGFVSTIAAFALTLGPATPGGPAAGR